MTCIDSEKGDFRYLPFEGDTLDQPYMTMNILKIVQTTYRKVMYQRNKEAMSKVKRSR